MIKVKVPATTANLGPGFDCLGMALSLYNIIEIDIDTDRLLIESDIHNDEIKQDEDNLFYKSFKKLYEYAGEKVHPIKIMQHVSIPVSRGLGSSAACIIGGLSAANYMLNNPFDNDRILEIASELEGHPDNVAPALFGGLTVAVDCNGRVRYVRHPLSNIKLMAMIPDFTLSTKEARKALPSQISYKDAVFNTGRASLLTASLITGNINNLGFAVQDKLHQPYRLPLIADGERIFKAAEDIGIDVMFISGSGPTLMGIANSCCKVEKMRDFCRCLNTRWDVKELEVDNSGVQVLEE